MGVCESLNFKNYNNNNNIKEINKDKNINNNINEGNIIKIGNNNINNSEKSLENNKNNQLLMQNLKKDNDTANTGKVSSSNYFERDTVDYLRKSGFFDKNIEDQLRKSGLIQQNSKNQIQLIEKNITEEIKKSEIVQPNNINASKNNNMISSKILPIQVMETVVNKPIVDDNIKVLPVIYMNDKN